MKSKNLPFRIVVVGLILALGATTSRADLLDGKDDPVTIPLAMNIGGGGTQGSYYFNMSLNGTPAVAYNGIGPSFSPPTQNLPITPEANYNMVINTSGLSGWGISFVVPRSYELYVNGQRQNGLQSPVSGASGVFTFTIVLHRNRSGGLPGEASRVRTGTFYWAAGLGSLPNGSSAGTLMIHQQFCPTVASRTLIDYSSFSPLVENLEDSVGLRQVLTPQIFVNIWDIANNSFQIDFYPIAAAGSTVNGYYSINGTPYASYQVTASETGFAITRITGTGTGAYSGTTTVTASTANNVTTYTTTFPGSLRSVTQTESISGNSRTEYTETTNAGGAESSYIEKIYHTYPWGEQLVQEIDDPNGNAYTTTYSYYTNSSYPGDYGQLQSITYPDGSWVAYSYFNISGDPRNGEIQTEYHPWLSTVGNPANANSSNSRAITYDYAADPNGQSTLEKSRVETINGITTGTRLTNNDFSQTANGIPLWVRTVTDSSDSSHTLTSVSKVYSPYVGTTLSVYANMPYSTQHPDGTMESYAQFPGTYNPATGTLTANTTGADLEQIVVHGVTPAVGSGTQVTSLVDNSADGTTANIDPIYLIPNQSTETITYRKAGSIVLQQTYVYTSAGFVSANLASWTSYTYTGSWKPASTTMSNGATSTSTYTNEFKTKDVDPTGIETDYVPDALQRVSTATKTAGSGYSGTGVQVPTSGIVTTYTYDGDNNVTATQTSGGGVTLTTGATYNLGGRLASTTDSNNLVTSYSDGGTGGLVRTTTFPGGATKVITKNLDGRVASVTGSAQVPNYFTYSVASTGFITTQQNLGASGSGNWSAVQADWLGRNVSTTVPDPTNTGFAKTPGGGTGTTINTYNVLGQLSEAATPGLAPTAYSYTAMGALEMTAVVLDGSTVNPTTGNVPISLSGADRISQIDTDYYCDNQGGWWQVTDKGVYATSGSSAFTTLNTNLVRLSGFSGSLEAEVVSTDVDGNQTDQTTKVNTSNQTVTTSITRAPLTGVSSQVTYNGLLVEQTSINGNTTTYGYDGIGRQVQVTDPRKGAINTIYGSPCQANQVYETQYATGPTLISQITYGPDGRVKSRTDEGGDVTNYTYDSMGDKLSETGNGTINVAYTYDGFGRMASQTTSAGSGNLPGVVDFYYDGDLPLLQAKEDALSNSVLHSYDSFGREVARQDSRGVIRTSTYDPNTGQLSGVAYSNDPAKTPAVSYTYTRTGAIHTVVDGTGTRTFVYESDLQIQSEALPIAFNTSGGNARTIDYQYKQLTGEPAGILSGINLSNSADAQNVFDQTTSYGYETLGGRLNSVTANGTGFPGYSFNYTYYPNSELLVGGVKDYAAPNTGYSQSYSYDSYRDLVTDSTTSYVTTTETKFDYTYNALDQRGTAAQSGSVFSDFGGSTSYTYSYDQIGQLSKATASLGGVSMPGREFAYTYDGSGNRLSADHTGGVPNMADTYWANPANQITQKENVSVAVQGNAVAAANVVVQTSLASRASNFWSSEAILANSNGPAYSSIPVYAGQAGAGSGGADLVSQTNITTFLGPFTETINYDADGDLVSDGRWSYTWDGEHRLIEIQTNAAAVAAGAPAIVDNFGYDYLGRRISKSVAVNGGQATVTRYVYFGWNVAAELDSSGNYKRHFIWGLDRSSSIGGLGGIGGLLMIQDTANGNSYLPAYDGSGNVAALLNDTSGGACAASYEYSPFGELLRKQGTYAVSNPFRFSTKWWDEETSLSYYGQRYYSSETGRFISRDPIEEKGGINLYAFCKNAPTNGLDYLGNCDDSGDDGTTTDPGAAGDTISRTGGALGFDTTDGSGYFGSAGTADKSSDNQVVLDFGTWDVALTGSPGPSTLTDPSLVGPDFNIGGLPTTTLDGTAATNTNSSGSPATPAPNSTQDYANMSQAAYGGGAPAGQTVLNTYTQNGVVAVLYQNASTGDLTLAYKGSSTLSDWGTDIANALGFKTQEYTTAVNIANQVVGDYPDAAITLTGHSLGGGMAGLAASATGLSAVTFNAAGANPAAYGYAAPVAGQIVNYAVATDIVTLSQTFLPINSALGTQVTLTPGNLMDTIDPFAAHGMNSVQAALGGG